MHIHKLLIESNSFSNNGNDIETDMEYLGQGEDYLVENFSATSGGKFSESTKNQIFGANMCKTII